MEDRRLYCDNVSLITSFFKSNMDKHKILGYMYLEVCVTGKGHCRLCRDVDEGLRQVCCVFGNYQPWDGFSYIESSSVLLYGVAILYERCFHTESSGLVRFSYYYFCLVEIHVVVMPVTMNDAGITLVICSTSIFMFSYSFVQITGSFSDVYLITFGTRNNINSCTHMIFLLCG